MLTARDVAMAMGHAVGAGGRTEAVPLEEMAGRLGPLAYGLVGLPMVSSVRAAADLGWSPSGPSLPYELIHGSLRQSLA